MSSRPDRPCIPIATPGMPAYALNSCLNTRSTASMATHRNPPNMGKEHTMHSVSRDPAAISPLRHLVITP